MSNTHVDFTTPDFVAPGPSEAELFFYEHGSWGYNPKTQTPEEGRWECARQLAMAERRAKRAGYEVTWEQDDIDSSDFDATDDDGEPYLLWSAQIGHEVEGEWEWEGSLGGIDLGPDQCQGYDARPHMFSGGPVTGEPLRKVYNPYVRVVEAELALEAMSA